MLADTPGSGSSSMLIGTSAVPAKSLSSAAVGSVAPLLTNTGAHSVKYTLGTELRQASRAMLMQVLRANNARDAAERRALRRMRPTRPGAIEGFPLPQLPWRVVARLAMGRTVLLVAQTGATGQRIEQRAPLLRWDPMPSSGNKRLLSV